ncbi:hypothetical protein EG028_16340 [Chitinophaga barathri]|uniref:Uncharacterized protein n=1 Tax=Chitinophaga barathri TaxID=1647451 RepID=A0A3N4MEX8_9BACT|nr:hypothetical protein EG028_16340 [Chitinophaga barathri]
MYKFICVLTANYYIKVDKACRRQRNYRSKKEEVAGWNIWSIENPSRELPAFLFYQIDIYQIDTAFSKYW